MYAGIIQYKYIIQYNIPFFGLKLTANWCFVGTKGGYRGRTKQNIGLQKNRTWDLNLCHGTG